MHYLSHFHNKFSASLLHPAMVKTDFPTLWKPPTHFAMVKADPMNFCKHPTRFAVVKTDSPNICKPPTSFKWGPCFDCYLVIIILNYSFQILCVLPQVYSHCRHGNTGYIQFLFIVEYTICLSHYHLFIGLSPI